MDDEEGNGEADKDQTDDDLKLEVFTVPDKPAKDSEYENLAPYEPTMDLRDYKYPTLSLLEAHGSEKIVQDAKRIGE